MSAWTSTAAVAGTGSVSIWLVEDRVNVTSCVPPKNGARIGVRSWKCPTTETVTRLPRPVGHPDTEQVTQMSAGAIDTPEAFASSCTRQTIRFVAASAGQALVVSMSAGVSEPPGTRPRARRW